MIYVMSGLQGQYEAFLEMLGKIGFSANDTLFILGDFVDRGDDGVKILLDVMNRPNVVPLIGNHDFSMLTLVRNEKMLVDHYGRDGADNIFRLWYADGGRPTYLAIRALDGETREKVLQYVAGMNYYVEACVNGRKYFLSHTLPSYDPETPLKDRAADDFIHGEIDYTKAYLSDTVTVTGHTPTELIDPEYRGRIWQGNGHIAVDCGIISGGTLGCICLDTMEEFYVKRK